MVDFAGSCVVHITGGLTALIATHILGPRTGRFHDIRGNKLDKPTPMPGHSMALQMLGVSLSLYILCLLKVYPPSSYFLVS